LPKGTDKAIVDLELAIKLLSCARKSGCNPEDGKKISANFGRFGPYVAHDGSMLPCRRRKMCSKSASITPSPCWPRRRLRDRAGAAPDSQGSGAAEGGKPIKVLKGKFGPYVSDGETNATCPKAWSRLRDHGTALALIAERAAERQEEKARQSRESTQGRKAENRKSNGAEKKNGTSKPKTTTTKKKAPSRLEAPGKSKANRRPKCPSWQANRNT